MPAWRRFAPQPKGHEIHCRHDNRKYPFYPDSPRNVVVGSVLALEEVMDWLVGPAQGRRTGFTSFSAWCQPRG